MIVAEFVPQSIYNTSVKDLSMLQQMAKTFWHISIAPISSGLIIMAVVIIGLLLTEYLASNKII